MRINIVLYKGESWILGKFANKLKDELTAIGHEISISSKPLNDVEVNHHIIYTDVEEMGSGINTIMVTHIDALHKWEKLKSLLSFANMCICMSSDTQNKMIDAGLDSNKICYINPAHDEIFKPQKIRLGFFSSIYDDGRKCEMDLVKALRAIDNSVFCMVIMGDGWLPVINEFSIMGLECEYYKEFDRDKYIELIESIDYLIYTGYDEGSMSFLDAVIANKKTIVTPQGFHLDIKYGITHSIRGTKDLIAILNDIGYKHLTRMGAIKLLTWENYAKSHLMVWNNLKNTSKSLSSQKTNQWIRNIVMQFLFFKTELVFKRKLIIHRFKKVKGYLKF